MADDDTSSWWKMLLRPTKTGFWVICIASVLVVVAIIAIVIKPELGQAALRAFGHEEKSSATAGKVSVKAGDGSSNQVMQGDSGSSNSQTSISQSGQNAGYILSAPANNGTVNFMPANPVGPPPDLVLQGDRVLGEAGKDLVLPRQIVTNGYALQIVGATVHSTDTAIVASLGSKLPKAAVGRTVTDGRNGTPDQGQAGTNGEDGGSGDAGANGKSASKIRVVCKSFEGNASINLDGQAGGDGGDGSNGGHGGDGGQGTPSRDGVGAFGFGDCAAGPGYGGHGGNGGRAGSGGNGGNGGDAGDVILDLDRLQGVILVRAHGGSQGVAGRAGSPGGRGAGGAEGKLSSYCHSAGRGGTSGEDGPAAPPAKNGITGKDGAIRTRVGQENLPPVIAEARIPAN